MINPPVLYIFSGLPASGKTTLCRLLAATTGAAYFRIDTVESALHELCGVNVETEGYHLVYRLVRENLNLGTSCIADSCNPVRATRDEWEQLTINSGVIYKNIEIRCSDQTEHRRRVESRANPGIPGPPLSWEYVTSRLYEKWHKDVCVIDTANKSIETSFRELVSGLALQQ